MYRQAYLHLSLWSLLATGVCLQPTGAQAHHVVTEVGVAPVAPQTQLAIAFGAGDFQVNHQLGSWQAFTPEVEWSPTRRLSLFGSLPFARLAVGGTTPVRGPGDLSVSTKLLLYETPHGGLLLSAGLGAELPTGSQAKGLGSGHFELAPFVLGSSSMGRTGPVEWLLVGFVSPRLTLGGSDHHGASDHHHLHGSLLAPHAPRELFSRLMVATVLPGIGFYAAAGTSAAAVMFAADGTFVAPGAEVGFSFASGLRLSAGAEMAVAGERRFGLRGRAALGWRP